MTEVTETILQLRALPRSERREALESVVVQEFKSTLLMADDEDLPLAESFFDLGFTSLRVTEAKERLETLLGCAISANVLFNSPTVERLTDYLASDVLTELFDEPETEVAGDEANGHNALWDDVMSTLYQT